MDTDPRFEPTVCAYRYDTEDQCRAEWRHLNEVLRRWDGSITRVQLPASGDHLLILVADHHASLEQMRRVEMVEIGEPFALDIEYARAVVLRRARVLSESAGRNIKLHFGGGATLNPDGTVSIDVHAG